MTRQTILIVDDDANLQRTLGDILGAKGYRVAAASTGRESLARVVACRPAVALIDLRLPDMDGHAVMRETRSRLPEVECIVLTGQATQESAIQAVNEGAFGYLQKPFDVDQLLVTVQRAIEKRQATEALRESEERLGSILDNSHTVVCLKDVEGRYLLINSRFEELFQMSRDEIVGKTDSDVFPDHVADQIRANDREVLRRGKAAEFEEWVPRPNGEARAFISVKFPLRSPEGIIHSIGGIATDITDRKQAERSLLQSSRLVALGQMAAGMAHELNQPLTVISTLAEGMRIRLEQGMEMTPERLQRWSGEVVESVERMTSIIEHLRVFSRDRSDEPQDLVALSDVVRGSLAMTQTQLTSRGIDVTVDVDDDAPPVRGDKYRLEQVLINLIANGRDAVEAKRERAPGGGREDWQMRLVIRTLLDSDKAVLEVVDNGVGMDEEIRRQALEPFYTTKGPDRGTGLGLSISHAIVTDHGGQIECESQEGVGSVFRVSLPVAG